MNKEKEKLKFVFPNIMSKFMKTVSMRTQIESSMSSMLAILIGMVLMVVYLIIYGQMSLFYKCLLVFNLFCAFIFISSFLVTTYQQYVSYMEMAEIDPDKEREEVLKKGHIFKRIRLAIKNKKSKNKPLELVDEAIENMVKIKQDELIEYQRLEKEADELRLKEKDLNSRIKEDINKDENSTTK